ncbi:MAG: hypothetical protein R6X23_08750 [Acidimicrobiia bacterium]
MIEPQQADLIRFRPVLILAAEAVVDTEIFSEVFEFAVRGTHKTFSDEDTDSLIVRANEAALLLIDTVRIAAPDVAAAIPANIEPALLRLQNASTEHALWQLADQVRILGTVLPVLGVVSWVAAIALAADRRRMLLLLAGVTTVAGVMLVITLRIVGGLASAAFDLPVPGQAAADVWDVYVDGLRAIAWFGILGGVVLAAAVQATAQDASQFSPARLRSSITNTLTREPRTRRARLITGLLLLVLGVAMFVSPSAVVATIVTALGAFTFYAALVYLLDLLIRPAVNASVPTRGGRRWAVGVASSLGCLLAVGFGVYLLTSSPDASAGLKVCNGRIEYCSRRLDQIALPTTHNSMTAADDGFLLPNQEGGMDRQLRDGVRGFQIDAYSGSVRTANDTGLVYTNLTDDKLLTIEDAVGPELAAQALQAREVLGPPPENTLDDVYLCHNFCELGAVKLSDEVRVLRRFLQQNPTEVVVWIIQDELPAEQLVPVLRDGGLDQFIATIDPTEPLPTLATLIASGRRLVVALENGDLGPELPNAFDSGLVQEVRYNYRDALELAGPDTCAPLRGHQDAPLFQFNHWVTPASLQVAQEINAADVLGERARRCRRERRLLPNLIAVDFYEVGDMFQVVDELNASP